MGRQPNYEPFIVPVAAIPVNFQLSNVDIKVDSKCKFVETVEFLAKYLIYLYHKSQAGT
jgi:hypothetical protein